MTFRTGEGEPLRGWLHDIGRKGCFITTQSRLPIGQVFELEFRLAGILKPIAGKAKVVWVREKAAGDLPAGMGVELVEMPDETLDAIDRFATATAAPKRSKTMLGVAPPPKPSSPSFSPEVPEMPGAPEPPEAHEAPEVREPEHPSADTAEDGVAAIHDISSVTPAPLPPEGEKTEELPAVPPPPFPPPPPPIALDRKKRPNARWIAIGGAAVALVAGIGCIVLAVRGCGSGASGALDAAGETQPEAVDAPAEAESEEEEDAKPTTAPVPSVEAVHDAGKDSGKDAGHDGGRDAGRDGGHDAGKKDAGKHKKHRGHH